MNEYCVYKHTSPSEKVYIGITKQNPLKRWSNGYGYKHNPAFYNAILKYGWENFRHEILFENLSKEEAEQKEIELITKFHSTDRKFGYNIENGGNCVGTHSIETRMKISVANKGKAKKIDPAKEQERIAHLRKAMCGTGNPFYGKKHSHETIQKISMSRIGNTWSIRKKVAQLDLNGNFLDSYDSITDAHIKTGISCAGICQCCKGIYKKSGGFIWRYFENE